MPAPMFVTWPLAQEQAGRLTSHPTPHPFMAATLQLDLAHLMQHPSSTTATARDIVVHVMPALSMIVTSPLAQDLMSHPTPHPFMIATSQWAQDPVVHVMPPPSMIVTSPLAQARAGHLTSHPAPHPFMIATSQWV